MGTAILTAEQIPYAGRVVAHFGDPFELAHRLDLGAHTLILPDIDDAALAAAVATYARQPAPTVQDVRAEAARRMQILVRARDATHLEIIVANASREAIRAASNALEAMEPIPVDYADDARWP